MHTISVVIMLCLAVLGGCTSNSSPSPSGEAPTKPEALPEAPPVAPAEEQPTALAVWQVKLTTQFLGTVAGPIQIVAVDSGGAVKVEVDGKVIGEATLPAAELEPLARLLNTPALANAKTSANLDGPQTHLLVTGDVKLDLRGMVREARPVLREVDRLRDLVAPPEHFKVTAIEGELEVMVSSNGHVEVKRGGTRVATHFLPVQALAKLQALLAERSLRTASAWSTPGGAAILRIDGDFDVSGPLDRAVASPGSAVLVEVLRLGDAVAAKTRPMVNFEAVLTMQLHGAGLGPLRTFKVRSRDRHLSLVDEAPGSEQSERPLTEEELKGLATMLIDPSFRTIETPPPSGEGMVYRVKITGDQPMEATYHGQEPPPLGDVLRRLDWLARHFN